MKKLSVPYIGEEYTGSKLASIVSFIQSQGGIVRAKYVSEFYGVTVNPHIPSLQRRGIMKYKLGTKEKSTAYYLFIDKIDELISYFGREKDLVLRYIQKLNTQNGKFAILDVIAADKSRYWSRGEIMYALGIPARSVWNLRNGKWESSDFHYLNLFRALVSLYNSGLIDIFENTKAQKRQTKTFFKWNRSVPKYCVNGQYFEKQKERLYSYPEFLREMGIGPLPFMTV